jgi:hypothetical protein
MDEFIRETDQLIEEALEERPYADLPLDFVIRVMAQIEPDQVQRTPEVTRFRLELLDMALPILGTCLAVLALGLTGKLAFLGIAAPIPWAAVLPPATLSLPSGWPSSNLLGLVGLLVFAEICVCALFCVWFWLDRPLPLANGQA